MYMRTKIALAALSLVLLTAPVNVVARPAGADPAHQALPQVSGPVAITPGSRPFLGAEAVLAAAGYVEEEYFLSGAANVYDWAGTGRAVKVIDGPGRYVTRILVRRPRDPARFGGNVEVTLLNASLGFDTDGPTDVARIVRQGDVWIGITTKAITAKALQRFDPVRYAPLDWRNPAPPAGRCAQPTMIPPYMVGGPEVREAMAKAGMRDSWPETEDGLVWDMLAQLGQLLKSERRAAILPGFGKPRIFMAGVSQSAIYIRTWLAGFHDRTRTPDGKPVYDGYLGVVGPAMIRINQCAADIALDDPRQKLAPPDVPFISISSEGEMWQARYTHQADAFTRRGGIVTYEVAGTSHGRIDVPGLPEDRLSRPPLADMVKAGMQMPAGGAPNLIPAGGAPNDLAWRPLVRGAFRNLQLWAIRGTRPPRAPGIALDAKREIARDRHGNAHGGVRTPYVEAPLAAYTGYLSEGGMGGITGAKRPLSPQVLKVLYPDQAAYLTQFDRATDRLLAGRWISSEDAAAMKAAARGQAPSAFREP